MKATAVKRIFNQLTQDAHRIMERARYYGQQKEVAYKMTIRTASQSVEYQLDEDSNWDIEDDTLMLETNKGTQWIATDKIESIEI